MKDRAISFPYTITPHKLSYVERFDSHEKARDHCINMINKDAEKHGMKNYRITEDRLLSDLVELDPYIYVRQIRFMEVDDEEET